MKKYHKTIITSYRAFLPKNWLKSTCFNRFLKFVTKLPNMKEQKNENSIMRYDIVAAAARTCTNENAFVK